MREILVLTFGYSGATLNDLELLAGQFDAVIVDTRFSRRSRNPAFSAKSLTNRFQAKYIHIPEFGNINHKNGGAIQLADAESGIVKIAPLLSYRSVILLCVCPTALNCHRSTVADLLSKRFSRKVRHVMVSELCASGKFAVQSQNRSPEEG